VTAGDLSRGRLAPWALAILLVAVGAIAGAALDRLAAGRPRPPGPPAPEEMAARMSRDLDLTDAQARAVRQVLDERWAALGKLFERIDPEAEAIRRDADGRIRALLRPEQRARFDTQVAEHEKRRAEMRKRLGRAPVPP
jgi:Spy/CpxP family protein refolding chaperone